MTQPLQVNWPDHYVPGNCPIHVRNELDMAASTDCVWAWLTRPALWPDWYTNSTNVKILDGSAPDLKRGTRFRWKTFGVTITSTVMECTTGEHVAWQARAIGIDVYHAWVLRASSRGCHVLTEETQYGWLARLSAALMPGRMHKYHQLWLEGLECKARAGLPPEISSGDDH